VLAGLATLQAAGVWTFTSIQARVLRPINLSEAHERMQIRVRTLPLDPIRGAASSSLCLLMTIRVLQSHVNSRRWRRPPIATVHRNWTTTLFDSFWLKATDWGSWTWPVCWKTRLSVVATPTQRPACHALAPCVADANCFSSMNLLHLILVSLTVRFLSVCALAMPSDADIVFRLFVCVCLYVRLSVCRSVCVCLSAHKLNKKLRYREEHSTSVLLSWYDISREKICWWLINHFYVIVHKSYRIRRNKAK